MNFREKHVFSYEGIGAAIGYTYGAFTFDLFDAKIKVQ